MSMIQSLYFGKDDAETDFTGSGLLKSGFLRTAVYNALKSKTGKSLVVGRKGSGKSALCLMLHKQFRGEAFASIITPDAISADEIKRFEMIGIDEQQSKKLVWRYIFLVQICKFILEAARRDWKSDSEIPPEIKKFRQFLVENQEVDDLNLQENFWRIINRIKTAFKLGAFGQSVEFDTGQTTSEGQSFGLKLDFLEKHLKTQLSTLNNHKFYLLVDKVDEIWDDDPKSDQMVIGLLMAAREINLLDDSIRCIVFLRSDMYDQIQFFDKDKLRGDEERIIWTEELLGELILARARSSTQNDNLDPLTFWTKIFPPQVRGEKSTDFLLDHTLMRPRDIIQLCNLCVDFARKDGSPSIQDKHVLQSLDVYSTWKLNDLIGEYRVNYPFLNDLLVLFSNTSYVIPKQRFQKLYSRIDTSLVERYPNYAKLLASDAVLNILYGIGFIGIERPGKIAYYYQDPKTVEEQDRMLIVHPAFRNALRCTSSVDLQPYSPSEYQEQREERLRNEITRGRIAFRGGLERKSQESDLQSLASRLYSMRSVMTRQEEFPSEVIGEISRNISSILNDLEENDFFFDDPIQGELQRMRIINYFKILARKLEEMGFMRSSKSGFGQEVERLVMGKY